MSEKNNDGITQISELKEFGIFKDFTWDKQKDFGERNLIYGWNYSGKTTLSRLFQILEFKDANTNKVDETFRHGNFNVKYRDNSNCKECSSEEQNVHNFPFKVKVFNQKYISDVFTWDRNTSEFEPILFYLGAEAGEINNNIQEAEIKKNKLEIFEMIISNRMKYFSEYTEQNGKFTELAKNIREKELRNTFPTSQFNKNRVGKIAEEIKEDLSTYILPEDDIPNEKEKAFVDTSSYSEQKAEFDSPKPLEDLKKRIESILNEIPKFADLKNLRENSELFEWVQRGLHFHKEPESKCEFCTNTLSKERFDALNAFYSDEIKALQRKINDAEKEIITEKSKFESLFPDESKIITPFREKYSEGLNKYLNAFEKYKKQLDKLNIDLGKKKDNLLDKIDISEIEEISLAIEIEFMESIIRKNNEYMRNSATKKAEAVEKLVKHYIAFFLEKDGYLRKEKIYNKAFEKVGKMQDNIDSIKEEILELKKRLRSISVGEEKLNKNIQNLLNTDAIKIEINNGKFSLKRYGELARNLSEGEKSTIAFSYFMTELESLQVEAMQAKKDKGEYPKIIAFIDDPISSLDSKHIFEVASLIRNFFEDTDVFQLFISTHNFDFLKRLIDTDLFGKIRPERVSDLPKKRNFYLIERKEKNNAMIGDMPIEYLVSRTEYLVRIYCLKKYIDSPDDASKCLILGFPNMLRIVIEEYTLMKYPSTDSFDIRLKEIFKKSETDRRFIDFLHAYSHPALLKNSMYFDEQLQKIEFAIKYFFDYLEEFDSMHWDGIKKSIESIDEAKSKSEKKAKN